MSNYKNFNIDEINAGFRTCSGCGITKSVPDYYLDRGLPKTICKACWHIKDKLYRQENKEKINKRRREFYQENKHLKNTADKRYREKNKDLIARRKQAKTYNTTVEYLNKLYESQKGLCKICLEPMNPACVDHNHTTGKIRGFLCSPCNLLIGLLEEDLTIVNKIWMYLFCDQNSIEYNELKPGVYNGTKH